jgi:hypothetical protein
MAERFNQLVKDEFGDRGELIDIEAEFDTVPVCIDPLPEWYIAKYGGPSRLRDVVRWAFEWPSDFRRYWLKPRIKHFFRHLWEKGSVYHTIYLVFVVMSSVSLSRLSSASQQYADEVNDGDNHKRCGHKNSSILQNFSAEFRRELRIRNLSALLAHVSAESLSPQDAEQGCIFQIAPHNLAAATWTLDWIDHDDFFLFANNVLTVSGGREKTNA